MNLSAEENGIFETCEEPGIGLVVYGPLGKGFLTGGYVGLDRASEGDFRKLLPRFSPEVMEENW